QSLAVDCRTMSALVNAANDIVMAARPTQTPVRDGSGEKSSRSLRLPLVGPRLRKPPPPEFPLSRRGFFDSVSGDWMVVAMALHTPSLLLLSKTMFSLPLVRGSSA